MIDFEKALKQAEGNIIHEGMVLTEGEKELIRMRATVKITQDEFIKRTIEYHTKNHDNIKRAIEEIVIL